MNRFGQLMDRPQRRVPYSTKGMDFVQNQILLAAELAKMAGDNYILSGCTVNGNNVLPGTMILNGEIIPFVGGGLQTKVRIVQTSESVTAGAETYEDMYIYRRAEFGSNLNSVDTFLWSEIRRLPTIKELLELFATSNEVDEIRDMVMPTGAIIMWSGSVESLPTGFALCDGSTVNGVVTPNLRGRFIVGYDATKVNTPANSTDLIENYGKVKNTGGRNSVTLTTTQMPSHTHAITDPGHIHKQDQQYYGNDTGGSNNTSRGNPANIYTQSAKTGIIINSAGGGGAHENRPAYYVLAFIIKVK